MAREWSGVSWGGWGKWYDSNLTETYPPSYRTYLHHIGAVHAVYCHSIQLTIVDIHIRFGAEPNSTHQILPVRTESTQLLILDIICRNIRFWTILRIISIFTHRCPINTFFLSIYPNRPPRNDFIGNWLLCDALLLFALSAFECVSLSEEFPTRCCVGDFTKSYGASGVGARWVGEVPGSTSFIWSDTVCYVMSFWQHTFLDRIESARRYIHQYHCHTVEQTIACKFIFKHAYTICYY